MSTPAEIRALVARLNNLGEIFRVQGEILACGEATVEPLTDLLLSPPSSFPEARVAAAECLAAIGTQHAIDSLIRVLDFHDINTIGPVQRLAEESVRNAAARRMARFQRLDVIDALLHSLERDHLIGAGQALAEIGEARAIPFLIDCLEDDYKKEKAAEALRHFGEAAIPGLCHAVDDPHFVEGAEPPGSEERRVRAAELLGELGTATIRMFPRETSTRVLRRGLRDESRRLRMACALSFTKLDARNAETVMSLLIAGFDDDDLLVRMACEEALGRTGAAAASLLGRAAAGEPLKLSPSDHMELTLRGRAAAVKLLGNIRGDESFRRLTLLLSDERELIRRSAVAALAKFPGDALKVVFTNLARRDKSRRIRRFARILSERRRRGDAEKSRFEWREWIHRLRNTFS